MKRSKLPSPCTCPLLWIVLLGWVVQSCSQGNHEGSAGSAESPGTGGMSSSQEDVASDGAFRETDRDLPGTCLQVPSAACWTGGQKDLGPEELCYSWEQLTDPCSPVHLWSVHQAGGNGGAGGATASDPGVSEEACPAVGELYWVTGVRLGGDGPSVCEASPGCSELGRSEGGRCCYRYRTGFCTAI